MEVAPTTLEEYNKRRAAESNGIVTNGTTPNETKTIAVENEKSETQL
jgi:hypothetical protein